MRQLHPPTRSSAASPRRRGLAPLEMVLLTPFLVLMGALMVNFGDAALWKIRSHSAAHFAGTQSDAFRQSHYLTSPLENPRPASWPAPAQMSGADGAKLTDVRAYWEGRYSGTPQVPYRWEVPGNVDAPLEGNLFSGGQPGLTDPFVGNFVAIDPETYDRQDIAGGANVGNVSFTKRFPMLTTILPNKGRYRVDRDYELLTGSWNFEDIGPRHNLGRRANDLYEVNPDEMPQLADRWAQFSITFDLLQNELSDIEKVKLNPLDDDDEHKMIGGRIPNFHPHPDFYCEIEIADYYLDGRYEDYLREIRNVPIVMAGDWIGMYKNELFWRSMGNPPRLPDSNDMLKQKIGQLEDFIAILRARNFVNRQ